MIAKKICLLGSFAVGKTSLTRRFVESIFFEKYHTTIGVKIDKKVVRCEDREIELLIWDIEGRDEFAPLRESYLRGAAAILLVVDLTRPDSLEVARELRVHVDKVLGNVPFLALLNKSDLDQDRRITPEDIQALQKEGWEFIETSAKTGQNVDGAFLRLTEKLLVNGPQLSKTGA